MRETRAVGDKGGSSRKPIAADPDADDRRESLVVVLGGVERHQVRRRQEDTKNIANDLNTDVCHG